MMSTNQTFQSSEQDLEYQDYSHIVMASIIKNQSKRDDQTNSDPLGDKEAELRKLIELEKMAGYTQLNTSNNNHKMLPQNLYNFNQIQDTQVNENGRQDAVGKSSKFEFAKLKKQFRQNKSVSGSASGNFVNTYQRNQNSQRFQQTNQNQQAQNRAHSTIQQKRQNPMNLMQGNYSKFEQYLRTATQLSEEDVLNPSTSNSAQLSARIQNQEFNRKVKKGFLQAQESLNDLAQLRQKDYAIEEVEDDEESPLKAMQIARRQSILNQKGLMQKRRESFFGPQNQVTPDSLQKLLQASKYLNETALASNQGNLTERKRFDGSKRESISLAGNATNGTFKNELLQKSLNNQTYILANNISNSISPEPLSNLIKSASNFNQDSIKPISYRDKLFLQTLEQQQANLTKSTNYINSKNNLALVLPELGKSPHSLVNDTVQSAMVVDFINEFNKESVKYHSLLIHLGVILKKAISSADTSQNTPTFFITTICCQILDKIALFFPQFSKVLVPLKNQLFQSVYYQYDTKKHNIEDEQEIENNKHETDLTKKNAKMNVKYLRYETYHDKLQQVLKEVSTRIDKIKRYLGVVALIDEQSDFVQNKELKKQIHGLKREYKHHKDSRVIINNLATRLQKLKQRGLLRQVFNTLRVEATQRYIGLYSQLQDHALIGHNIAHKTLMRKFWMDWQVYTKECKLRKCRKEIEYYQSKYDDQDFVNNNLRNRIQQLTEDNMRIQSIMNQKNHRLAVQEKDIAQMNQDNSQKKPLEVRKLLKMYFKFIFTNPLIMRIRLNQESEEVDVLRKNQDLDYSNIDDDTHVEMNNQPRRIHLHMLLKPKETLWEGGQGVSALMSLGLRDIMIRWANYMMERAQVKLNTIIDLLQKEVDFKESRRQLRKKNQMKNWEIKQGAGIVAEESSDDSDSSDISGISHLDQNRRILQSREETKEQQQPETETLNENHDHQGMESNYKPFRRFKKDLKLLITFKAMISKMVTSLGLNLIHDGVLLGILFAIDISERALEIKHASSLIAQIQGQAVSGNFNTSQSNLKKFQSMAAFDANEVEEVFVPDYKSILLYVNSNKMQFKASLVFQEVEKIQNSKIDWYFSVSEFLSGNESVYTNLLCYLFYTNSMLDKPQQLSSGYHQNDLRQFKGSTMLTQKQIDEEQRANVNVFKKVLFGSRQKILPLLQRKVHSHLQDVTLLYSQQEMKSHEYNPLQQMLELPFKSTKEIILRWANHLLRSYDDIKAKYGLELEYKQKYQRSKSPDMDLSNQASTSQSPVKMPQAKVSLVTKKRLTRASQSYSLTKIESIILNKDKASQNQEVQQFSIRPQLKLRQSLEIQKLSDLSAENYHKLVIILAFLSPESLWDMYELDFSEIKKLPHFVDLLEGFLEVTNNDMRNLFVMNAISRVSKKNHLITLDDLYSQNKFDYVDLLIELFLHRPYLSNSKSDSVFMESLQTVEDFYNEQKDYLRNFDRDKFELIDNQISRMKIQRDELTRAFAFVQDCGKIYNAIKEKLLFFKLDSPNPATIIARQMNLHKRPDYIINEIEKQILSLNKDFLFQIVHTRQPYLNSQWVSMIELTIRKYLYPMRRYLNIYFDKEGYITYFDMWRAIKSLNIRTFNIDSREIECVIVQIIKLKDNEAGKRRSLNLVKEDGATQIFNQLDQDQEIFLKKLKSEIQYKAFDQGRSRLKSSIVREIEGSLENPLFRTQVYRVKFNASDFVLVLLAIVFKINSSDLIQELIMLNPSLKDESIKNVNKMLNKDKIQQHLEQYLIDFTPGVVFENFLINCVFIKSDFTRKHPFRFNMMKEDFRSFLDHYLNSLFAVFDFYLNEYSGGFPQIPKYRFFCLQLEAVYGLLQDFDAFKESGMNKQNFRKILINIQRQVASESKTNNLKIKESNTPTKSPIAAQKSPVSVTKSTAGQGDSLQQLIEGFHSLTFFEFMELLYLVSQYYNPDPFINQNQKFADFLEKVVFVHIQFKLKNKKLVESPHKNNLLISLQNQKILRGAQLETFNAYFDLQ